MKRIADGVFVFVCAFFVLFFGTAIFAKPPSYFSEQENRRLADFPSMSVQSITDGRFSQSLGKFFTDQFPFRTSFTDLKARVELLLGRAENNGVVFGESGYMVIKPEYESLTLYTQNISYIKNFCEEYEEKGIESTVFFAPRGIDVLERYIGRSSGDSVWKMAKEELSELVEANDALRNAVCRGEYVWNKTDHHFTALGAYISYLELSGAVGIEPIKKEELSYERLSTEFYGTVYSRSGLTDAEPDEFFIYRWSGDDRIKVIDGKQKELSGLYFFDKSEQKDKYEVFLGGNYGHIGIYGEGEGREKVIVIKDSFANSVIPYLSRDIDMEVYDLRYFSGSIREEIERICPDRILIFCGIDTVATDGSFKRLGY